MILRVYTVPNDYVTHKLTFICADTQSHNGFITDLLVSLVDMMIAIIKRKDKFHIPSCLYFLLAGILVSVQAGFEHTCTSDDISGGRRQFCGRQLTELVFARCGGEPAGRSE